MCHSGVGLTPLIEGKEHHFSAGGLYNGLVLLIDDETRTYWDHITGAAVHGPLRGARMDAWSITLTTVAGALEQDPQMTLSRQPVSAFARVFGFIHRHASRPRRQHRVGGSHDFYFHCYPPFDLRVEDQLVEPIDQQSLAIGGVDLEGPPLSRRRRRPASKHQLPQSSRRLGEQLRK